MKFVRLVAVLLAVALLASCAMLPEEEVFEKSPVVKPFVAADYELTYVLRGDIALTESISCKYRAVREETLCFEVGDEFYDEIYVSKGDVVKAGDLLAELQMGDLNDRIEQLTYSIELQKLEVAHARENMRLALARQEILLEGLSEAQLEGQKSVEDVRVAWEESLRALEDDLYVQQLTLEECLEDKRRRQVIAGIDGTVTYLRSVKEGDKSVEGERFVKLADATQSVFAATTENYDCLPSGTLVEITANKIAYPAVVQTAEELGILGAGTVMSEKKREVYFKLLEPATDLETDDRGRFDLVLDSRTDVLYLPVKAIVTANEQNAVYVKDQYGLKSLKVIETGLRTGKFMEIVSGLNEGDAVIVA